MVSSTIFKVFGMTRPGIEPRSPGPLANTLTAGRSIFEATHLFYRLILLYFLFWGHQLYGHLPPTTKTIQVRRTRHAGHCWRSKDELISDVLLWTPTYGQSKAGRPARTYIQQLCEDTGCNPEDLPEAMKDRETWRDRVRDICAGGTTWWWWLSILT